MSVATSGNYYGAGSGVDAYTGVFIPEIWSGKLQTKFYKATVLGDITNNDWEGEIKGMGDKVQIRTVPDIVISSYTKGQTLTNQVPTGSKLTLNIDQAKYFSFVLDDVDAVQTSPKLMDNFSTDASEKMKIAIDSDVLGTIAPSGDSHNRGAAAGVESASLNLGATGAQVQVTNTNAVQVILDAGQALDEQNIPETGRFIVIPPWFANKLKGSDLKQVQVTGDDQSPIRNGKIGMVDRFTVYTSNNLAKVTDTVLSWTCLFGHPIATTFASQMTNMEKLRAQSTFGDIVRGLNVYGYKVVTPVALGSVYVKP